VLARCPFRGVHHEMQPSYNLEATTTVLSSLIEVLHCFLLISCWLPSGTVAADFLHQRTLLVGCCTREGVYFLCCRLPSLLRHVIAVFKRPSQLRHAISAFERCRQSSTLPLHASSAAEGPSRLWHNRHLRALSSVFRPRRCMLLSPLPFPD